MKKPIITIGASGLVGSRISELLEKAYDFIDLSFTNGLDITDRESILRNFQEFEADTVILLAAKANVDGCEADKTRDQEILKITDDNKKEEIWKKEKTAWAVNVYGVQNVVEVCEETKKRLIYISTDFVFDGKRKSYLEEDMPNPINWYGKTKYEGEKIVQNSNLKWIIARVAYPYRASYQRNDFVRAIIYKLKNSEPIKAINDHIMVPTFIDDIVNALDFLIQKQEAGIFHVVGSQSITPYEAAIKIANEFNFNQSLISKTTRIEYFAGKALRPFCLNLKNDKISLLGVEMSSFDQGLKQVKIQMEKLKI